MSALQLPLPIHHADLLTPFDEELYGLIREHAGPDGSVSSLFDLAVRRGGLSYHWSLYRLGWLELLGYVRVRRGPRRSDPLTIWPLV